MYSLRRLASRRKRRKNIFFLLDCQGMKPGSLLESTTLYIGSLFSGLKYSFNKEIA